MPQSVWYDSPYAGQETQSGEVAHAQGMTENKAYQEARGAGYTDMQSRVYSDMTGSPLKGNEYFATNDKGELELSQKGEQAANMLAQESGTDRATAEGMLAEIYKASQSTNPQSAVNMSEYNRANNSEAKSEDYKAFRQSWMNADIDYSNSEKLGMVKEEYNQSHLATSSATSQLAEYAADPVLRKTMMQGNVVPEPESQVDEDYRAVMEHRANVLGNTSTRPDLETTPFYDPDLSYKNREIKDNSRMGFGNNVT